MPSISRGRWTAGFSLCAFPNPCLRPRGACGTRPERSRRQEGSVASREQPGWTVLASQGVAMPHRRGASYRRRRAICRWQGRRRLGPAPPRRGTRPPCGQERLLAAIVGFADEDPLHRGRGHDLGPSPADLGAVDAAEESFGPRLQLAFGVSSYRDRLLDAEVVPHMSAASARVSSPPRRGYSAGSSSSVSTSMSS